MEKPYHKSKEKSISTITSDEDDIRFRIWSGEIPLWEAAKRGAEIHARHLIDYCLSEYRMFDRNQKEEIKNLRALIRFRLHKNKHLPRIIKELEHWVDYYEARERAFSDLAYKDYHPFRYHTVADDLRKELDEEREARIKDNLEFQGQVSMLGYYMNQLKDQLQLSGQDGVLLFKTVDDLTKRLEGYKVVIKYLQKELAMYRKDTVPVPNVEETKRIHRVLYSIQGVNTVMDNIIDLKEHVMNKEKLKVGTDDGIVPPIDWLSELETDTVFTCEPIHPNDPNPLLQEYILIFKGEKGIKLLANLNEPEVYVWVNPRKFCALYQLVEVLGMNPNGE